MPRAIHIPRLLVATLCGAWLFHLSVNTIHAQDTALAGSATPQSDASAASPAPAETWHPKRFGHLYTPPAAAAPQHTDAERPPAEELRLRHTPRHHSGLLIGGAVTFMSSYFVTAIAAAMVSQINASDCQAGDIAAPCHDGNLMLVPLVGPLLTNRSTAEQALLAVPQILGAVLALAGVFHYASRPLHAREHASLDVYPVPLPGGGLLAARLQL